MVLKISKINEQYIYGYVGFSEDEVNEYFAESPSKITSEESFQLLDATKRMVVTQHIKSILQIDVHEAILNEGYLIISEPLITYRGEIEYNKPLFLIVKLCVVPDEMELVFPETKMMFNKGSLPREVLDEVIRSLLIKSGYYSFHEVNQCNSFEQIANIDFICNGKPLKLSFNPDDGNTLVDFHRLFGYNKNDDLPFEIFDIPNLTEAKLVSIYQKVPHRLTDDLVKKMHITDVSTVKEFEKEINDTVHPNRQRMVLVDKIIDFIAKHSDIVIYDELIDHFINVMARENAVTYEDTKIEWDFYNEEIKEKLIETLKVQMVRLYLIRVAQDGFLDYEDEYLINIQEQYEEHLDNLLNSEFRIDEHGLFLREQLDYAILFNFFVEQDIIIL